MDNNNEYENPERMNSNTEYLPTKCRITKPPPPKPATNPLQFVKVAPCPLFQKAHEQIKKVEEIKKERKEIREEAEDWQQNLDNWKSCRRKRQEHIIERVVEVKKMEQEEQERHRKKNKTFNEMIEDRTRGRHKFSIPIYDDDSNDLSDYGIGSSSSKTNSIKDADTDDSCSILDEKENRSFESPCNKDNSSASNQSQSEDETNISKKDNTRPSSNNVIKQSTLYTSTKLNDSKYSNEKIENPAVLCYTYEGAIQDYRSRIRSRIFVDESVFNKNQDYSKSKEFSEAQTALPKGEIFKRKELFETERPVEINNYESPTNRRLSEDFANSQSIKQRLQSLEKCTEQSLTNDKNDIQTIKQRLQNFNKQNDDKKNNNNNNKARPAKISSYLIEKSNTVSLETRNNKTNVEWKKKELTDRCSSPETELYMDNLKTFSRDLDNLMYGKSNGNNIEDYCVNPNYPPSTSSTEMMGVSSDREDSGIHTADVSCSVSQADEPVEDTELAATTIPNCIEKLTIEERNEFEENKQNENDINYITTTELEIQQNKNETSLQTPTKEILDVTQNLIESLRKDSSENQWAEKNVPCEVEIEKSEKNNCENVTLLENKNPNPVEFISSDIVIDDTFPLAPPTMIEPPKVKPPPPPPVEEENVELSEPEMKRINSTKRIKREIHIKRSSFLGLDEPTEDQIYPEMNVDKPPDINSFLQKESKLEKSLYKKALEENRMGILSKVESHDSGLDIDRGRLSSDTWCSSIGDSNTPSPERQDSEQTNSITSEEDEITKKEREIIEMVEKEEKSRDIVEYLCPNEKPNQVILRNNQNTLLNEPYFGSENFNTPYYPKEPSGYPDDQDSEVLKVEHELRQLEREELKRQHENMLFQESRAKARLQNNRHSSENIFDDMYPPYQDGVNYRKSMPELQHIPLEYRKSLTDVPNAYNVYRPTPELDVQYRKSMPDIQHAYHKSVPEYHMSVGENPLDHRKSMPDIQRSAFKSPPPAKRQPIMPGKPIRPMNKEQRDRYLMMNPGMSDPLQHPNGKSRQLSRHSLQALSAVPKNRHLPDWVQTRPNAEKNTKQHWLIQEAELRRISEQKNAAANRNWQQPRQEKHLPDSVIQTLTQRAQTRAEINERNQAMRRSESSPSKDSMQHTYLGHNQTMGHALPMPYPPPVAMEDTQDRMLSVSGKKKCSNCNKELGRGAAMIIESLCLFYHMECFICCVCHMQLGDGRMGTDVRVRNQKLHCHNCYSSDDGVKFSCV